MPTYELVTLNGDQLGSYATEQEGRQALARILHDEPDAFDTVALLEFDREGMATRRLYQCATPTTTSTGT